MARKDYSDFLTHVLYDMKLRRIEMTDIYNTKDYIETEYHSLFAEGNCIIYYLFHDFSLDYELKFYLYLDMLTYLPFEKLGYEYLNNELEKENSNIIEFKYNTILRILSDAEFNVNEELDNNIKYFLNNYYNDEIELNIIGLAIILLRLFHRYVTIMNFGGKLASMTIHKKIGNILDQIVNEVNENELKEININDYLPEFDYEQNKLNDDMIKYIELCLERES